MTNFFEKISYIFKLPDLRNKILFILLGFLIFRIVANIPAPGINELQLKEFFARFEFFGLLSAFTGGALDNLSIAMLGLGPYITASIIMQLLTMVFPSLEKMYKEEGEVGRKKINQYARFLTVPIAFVQGYGTLMFLQNQRAITFADTESLILSLFTIVAGAVFLMWLGEIISEKGIGNGISLLIFAGIVSALPTNIRSTALSFTDQSQIISYLEFFVMAFAIITLVVYVQEARRNIPVSYARRVRGMKLYGGVATYLPLQLNPAGVIPIIFAFSFLLLPGTLGAILSNFGGFIGFAAERISNIFKDQLVNGVLLFFLIIGFTYFYTAVIFDPKTISNNLQRMGGFIPGIRPGTPTVNYLYYVLNRILFVGGITLGIVALMPSIAGAFTNVHTFGFFIGGTSVIIIVSVIIDLINKINAQLKMREYDTI
ncbi:Protein translocase subunit SecY [bacterium HR34]|nr:Protein translocase subunit SecY [bacterium HR34]